MITIASLYKVALDNGANQADLPQEDDFEVIESCTEVIDSNETEPSTGLLDNPLQRYSLNGMSQQYMQQMEEETFVLDGIALNGQITNIYAQPGSGKTLITMKLLMDLMKTPENNTRAIYYVNADDNHKGLTQKLAIAEEFGFEMLAPGHQGFKASDLVELLLEMANKGSAVGVVIVLDTIKKFTDPMSKSDARKFWNVVRQFVSKGGTLITLAHANKNLNSEGKPIYAGTSDSLDDTDCAFTLRVLNKFEAEQYKVVEFENVKNRGQVESKVCYRYSTQKGLNYRELLDSVEKVDVDSSLQGPEEPGDSKCVQIIEECINEGINKKMELINAAVEHSGISKRKVRDVIELYTGDDPSKHKWNFERRDRGAHIFYLLPPIEVSEESEQTC